ncbi:MULTISPECIES: type II toxin-antitoxin system HipA family toxin [unclassified Sphingomonas]|uniref:type II toxin-antitoxin system HipA family toxin n=1 Tax=unclassified Sphingomonas TaxID=196159 RepID=UPI000925DCA6|nr:MULTISPECIES: type II toxin-antitoxin system HipA family toxin [unclassified Sphingomonas]OJU15152.1 MAG: serine/threonine protein kinase [Sphingomonas sp. 66-10]
MSKELFVLLSDRVVGRVTQDDRARFSFIYDEGWRDVRGTYPLSLSMPLAAIEHRHEAISAYVWGLLPDNELVLDRWAKRFQVSARNPFALIANVGEDCAGAVQFVRPERLDAVLAGETGDVAWLENAEIAARIRQLREDQSAWRRPGDTGQFSLAGAQPKTALLLQDGRWGVPSGRIPTTHILKPPSADFDGHAENEHFCLALARALGLPVATSTVMRFEDEVVFVVDRYDRQATDRGVIRIHQEDMCQALGVPPTHKYENEGGPGVSAIAGLLREHSRASAEDVQTFLDALALNWLIGGTDAHAKNYSILIGAAGRIRLAPLYDVASILPYGDFDPMRVKLAMKIGGKYRLRDISPRNWEKVADELGLDQRAISERIRAMADALPAAADGVQRDMRDAGMAHEIVDRLADMLKDRAAKSSKLFALAESVAAAMGDSAAGIADD